MPLTSPNFTATQSLGSPSIVTLTDTSSGTDVGLTERRVYFILADGSYLTTSGSSTTPAYDTWAIADSTVALDILPRDLAVSIVVQWMTGSTISYTKTINYVFTNYDYIFLYGLTTRQVSNPTLLQDTSFFNNKLQMIVNLDDAENAVSIGNDLFASQEALDRNYVFIQNESFYF